MEFKTEKSSFRLMQNYIKEVRTTEGFDTNVKEWLDKFWYQIECCNEKGQKLFRLIFSSSDGYIIPKWVNHQYSQEKMKSLSPYVYSQVATLTNQADKKQLENCQRLKECLEKDTCFGINVIKFGDHYNQSSSYIQIIDFWQYGEEEQTLYYKGGVWTEKERPIKISEYRHMLEWKPHDKQIKLTNLGIGQGQKYASDAYLLFEMNYNGEVADFSLNNIIVEPDEYTLNTWVTYVKQIIDDKSVADGIPKLIKKKSLTP